VRRREVQYRAGNAQPRERQHRRLREIDFVAGGARLVHDNNGFVGVQCKEQGDGELLCCADELQERVAR
jgi:hypothetical protein